MVYSGDVEVIRCDTCPRALSMPGVDVPTEVLPWPWRRFPMPGYVGDFHACSDTCEAAKRRELLGMKR